MSRQQYRVYIRPEIFEATASAAKACRISHADYIERALLLMIDPVSTLDAAARVVRDATTNLVETQDQIRLISDFVTDRYREETEE